MPRHTFMFRFAVAMLLTFAIVSGLLGVASSNRRAVPAPSNVVEGVPADAPRGERLVVHEWGTFTSLQDEQGVTVTGINADDEPVPGFVHRHPEGFIHPGARVTPRMWMLGKALPSSHPNVNMRMETPVLYFYPPADATLPMRLDVRVDMRGGWLTEFYPRAVAEAPGITTDADSGYTTIGRLEPDAVGSLTWQGVTIGAPATLPATDDEVWLAPRRVRAATVTNAQGEAERFLFYRGVANMESPLRATRVSAPDGSGDILHIDSAITSPFLCGTGVASPNAMWLVDVRRDGGVAFRSVTATGGTVEQPQRVAQTLATFDAAAYGKGNRAELRSAMHAALVAEGLFDDEATAMLDTWDASYFRTPGMRLFYVLPQWWTAQRLPLTLSTDADVTRVMVGRLELITPDQRALINRIAAGPVSDGDWMRQRINAARTRRLAASKGAPEPKDGASEQDRAVWQAAKSDNPWTDVAYGAELGELTADGAKIPEDFRAYVDLGRFRSAILLHEKAHRPTEALNAFLNEYWIYPYYLPKPTESDGAPETSDASN
ncbi:MAG: hypothetical protein GC159_05255 [Phycisphaera sp.]|nr:hypothetical protein [Phycisphaera sp.]